MISKTILHTNERLKQLCQKVQPGDVYLIENPLDLYYFTGLSLSAGKLFVHALDAMLFVDGRYLQIAHERAPIKAAFDEKKSVLSFLKEIGCKTLCFDGGYTTYDRYVKLQELNIELKPKSALFKTLRMIKDEHELEKMRQSAHLLWKGFEYIVSQLAEGITEKEIARRFEIFCLQHGGEGLAFDPIIAFGVNSAMPHYHPEDVPLKAGDLVLIDIGVVLEHYHSDMTRVVFFKQANPALKKLYDINKAAHDAALRLCRPGTKLGALDRAARDVMAEHNVEHLFVHSLGHGIGLETHEAPRIKHDAEDKDIVLQPGMVFTVEPGLYSTGIGGVRYEDTIIITQTGYENLYPDTLKFQAQI